ncbi:MAG TPA: aldo/keto reductase, partial [Candidatus Manganitrophaceae bacterium]|nr:aldo/keto reductase [Candidatus Manganitrophaceae bacterium]
EIASRHGITPARVALAWLLQKEGVIVVAKASRPEHVRENRAALDVHLPSGDLAELEEAFPAPRKPTPLKAY